MHQEIEIEPFIEKYIWNPIVFFCGIFYFLFFGVSAIVAFIWVIFSYPLAVLFALSIPTLGYLFFTMMVEDARRSGLSLNEFIISLLLLIFGVMAYTN